MNAAQIRADLIAQANERIAEDKKALESLRNVLLGQGFIVVSHIGVALSFEFDAETSKVHSPTTAGCANKATRFTKADAERIAASVLDGKGDHGRAVHVVQAIRDSIADQERLIDMIRATGPVAGE